MGCLNLPSKLQRELFTLAVTAMLLILTTGIAFIYRWRKNDLARQAMLAKKDAEKHAEEMAAAKKAIEEREAADAKKRRERQAQEGINLEEDVEFQPVHTLRS